MPDYTWVGIYLLDGNELVLGPFVGKPSPHTRIPLGRGICGAAATEKADDHRRRRERGPALSGVQHRDAGRRSSCRSCSGGEVLGEIDIDSDRPAAFGRRGPRAARSGRGAARRARSRTELQAPDGAHHHAHPRRRHRPGSHRGGRPHPQGRRRRDRVGAPRRRRRSRSSARPVAAGGAARLDPAQQGRAEGAGDDADRRRASPASTSACARRSISTRTCGRCGTCRASTSRFTDVDLVIVRENTEDLYAGLEHEVVPGRRREPEDHHREGVDADRAVRVRARARGTGASG